MTNAFESPERRVRSVRNDPPVFTANEINLFRMLSVLRCAVKTQRLMSTGIYQHTCLLNPVRLFRKYLTSLNVMTKSRRSDTPRIVIKLIW